MAKHHFTPTNSTLLSQADGRMLAVDMLIEFRESNSDEVSIEQRYRPGKPQSDILGRYQRVVKDHNNPTVEAGFNAVVNDLLSHFLSGGCLMEPEFYEALDDAEIEREATAEERGE